MPLLVLICMKTRLSFCCLSVLGCDTLAVRNVTVTKSGNLTLIAPGYVTLNGLFETNLGEH